jgi:hypothetical protein
VIATLPHQHQVADIQKNSQHQHFRAGDLGHGGLSKVLESKEKIEVRLWAGWAKSGGPGVKFGF